MSTGFIDVKFTTFTAINAVSCSRSYMFYDEVLEFCPNSFKAVSSKSFSISCKHIQKYKYSFRRQLNEDKYK